MNEININGEIYIKKSEAFELLQTQDSSLGKYCIVRCKDAGVWAGTVVSMKERVVSLRDARRLWYWVALKGFTLSAVANYGLREGKMPSPVDFVELLDACEVIPCTSDSKKTITSIAPHNE